MEAAPALVGNNRRGATQFDSARRSLRSPRHDDHRHDTPYLSFCVQNTRAVQFLRHRRFRCCNALLTSNPSVHSNGANGSSLPAASPPRKTTGPSSDRTGFQLGVYYNLGLHPNDEVRSIVTSLFGLSNTCGRSFPISHLLTAKT